MSRSLAFTVVPVLALLTAACDPATSKDGTRYQQWAQTVSSIPLDPAKGQDQPAQQILPLAAPQKTSSEQRLRVELMTPHQLWDARNGPLKVPTMEVLENVSPTELVRASTSAGVTARPPVPEQPAAAAQPAKLIQLGAYSSEQSARTAWQRVQSSLGNTTTALQPRYETVEVSGRQLVRLRVAATEAQALHLCQALASNDPWCKSPSR